MNRMISMLMRIFISQVMRQGIRKGIRGMGGGGRRQQPRQTREQGPRQQRVDHHDGPGDGGPDGGRSG